MKRALLPFAFALIALARPGFADDPVSRYDRRWVWVMSNLLVDKEADRVVGLVERAGPGRLQRRGHQRLQAQLPRSDAEHYFDQRRAGEGGGRAGEGRAHPGGLPDRLQQRPAHQRRQPRRGHARRGRPLRRPGSRGGPRPRAFGRDSRTATWRRPAATSFAGFGYQDAPGKATVADREVVHHGKVSCRMQDLGSTPVCRLIQPVKVRPHACYRLSCWAKTRDLAPTGAFRLLAIGRRAARR